MNVLNIQLMDCKITKILTIVISFNQLLAKYSNNENLSLPQSGIYEYLNTFLRIDPIDYFYFIKIFTS